MWYYPILAAVAVALAIYLLLLALYGERPIKLPRRR